MSGDRRAAQFRGGRGVTTASRAACVIGWPVEHSRSPLIHNYWLKHYGIAGEYRRELVPPRGIRRVRRIARRTRLCRRQRDRAAQGGGAGACRSPTSGRARSAPSIRCGSTTACCARPIPTSKDFWTISTPARRFGIAARNKAVVLGAGGAARAVIYGLLARGVERIVVVNRTLGRAETLRQTVRRPRRCGRAGMSWTPRSPMRRSSSTPRRSACRDSPLSPSISRGLPGHARRRRSGLCAGADAAPRGGKRARSAHGRRARHAAASGGARLCAVVRQNPRR